MTYLFFMDGQILTIQHLSKNYSRIQALDDINFTVPKASVFGLLGPNGSGKSTTLGIILGIINQNKGSYQWFDGLNDFQARRRIGSLLEQPNFYPYLSAQNNLAIICEIKGVSKDIIPKILDKVGLLDRKDSLFKTFSTGMKQRLAIGACLLSDPEVVVLDEPTNGLDPQGIVEVRELILQISKSGKTIILASHLLDEVEKVCTHYAVLKKGRILDSRILLEGDQDKFFVISSDEIDHLQSVCSELNNIQVVQIGDKDLTIKSSLKASEINTLFFKNKIILNHLSEKKTSLEDRFLEITKHA
jgi:ABC-2 type transport system ATP-binding protein